MTKYLFEVWNVAGMNPGQKFTVECEEGKDPYYGALLPILHDHAIECWHIDFVYRKHGQYRGSWEEVLEQRAEEQMVQDISCWIVPNARYNNGWDDEAEE